MLQLVCKIIPCFYDIHSNVRDISRYRYIFSLSLCVCVRACACSCTCGRVYIYFFKKKLWESVCVYMYVYIYGFKLEDWSILLRLEWKHLYSKKNIGNIFKFHLWWPPQTCSEHMCVHACVYVCLQGSLLKLAWVQCTDIWINLSVIFSVALIFYFLHL